MSEKSKGLKKHPPAWNKVGVIICTKCSSLFDKGELQESKDCGDALKGILKSRLKSDHLQQDCRVMTSSCQNVCIDNRQAVTLFTANGTTETFTMHPEKDREELYDVIKAKISSGSPKGSRE